MSVSNTTNSSFNTFAYPLVLAPRSIYEVIFESLSIIIIIILALFGNILVFWIVYNGGLSRSSNLLMINLAMTDVMSSVVSLPLVLVTIATGKWIMGDFMCQFQAFCSYTLYSCTLCSLMVVSVNRYTLLAKPLFHRKIFGRRSTVAIVIGIWVMSLLFASPPLLGWSRYVFLSDYAICVTDPLASPSFNTFLFLFLLVNMLIITICYLKIFTILRNIKKVKPAVANHEPGEAAANHAPEEFVQEQEFRRQIPTNPTDSPSKQANPNLNIKSKENEITAIIFIIVCLFGFCYLPTFIVGFFVFSSSPITRSMRLFSTFSVSLTSVVNPIVYSIKSKVYRKQVKHVYRSITGCY